MLGLGVLEHPASNIEHPESSGLMELVAERVRSIERTNLVRQLAMAGSSGILLVLAFPKWDLGFLAFVALVPLLLALQSASPWRAFFLGLAAGSVFYLGSLSWVTYTMTVYGGLSPLFSLLILLSLAFYLALYFASFGFLVAKVKDRPSLFQVLFFSTAWVALEYVRTYALTGFPWNLLGYSQYKSLSLIQIASFTGVYGISFLVAAVNASIASVIRSPFRRGRALVPLFLILLLGGGAFTYSTATGFAESMGDKDLQVALLQGNIDQGVKWDPVYQTTTLETYHRLTLKAAEEGAALIVWPETAVPFFLRWEPGLSRVVLDMASKAKAFLLVGSPDRERGDEERYFNSAFLISPDGQITEKYDKIHMVPFGEYVPLKRLLFFVQRMAEGIGDFSGGERYTIFSLPKGRFGVTICYEAIFPNQVRQYVNRGADFLVNITNDAWFGRSSAPYQHLAMAAFRAVENQVYVIRAANTGVTAIINPSGRIVQKTDLFVAAVLVGGISLKKGTTFYTRHGDLFAWVCVAFALAALAGERASLLKLLACRLHH
ncbi:MAG: apolipoprotein N-acyltransferase [candidate division NC10 bacterium]|nr:apolipoprotein N-acyltransferase [candidate division NC10 bacterium]